MVDSGSRGGDLWTCVAFVLIGCWSEGIQAAFYWVGGWTICVL